MTHFLSVHVMPWIHARWHLTTDPARIVLTSSSAGGLGSVFVLEHPDVIGNVLSLSGAFCRGAAGSSEGFAYPTFTRTFFAALHRMRGLREHAYAVDVVVDGESAIVQAAVNGYDAKQRADHERTTAAVSCGLRRMQC